MVKSYEDDVNERGENLTSIFVTYMEASFRTTILPVGVDEVLEIARKGAELFKEQNKHADLRAEVRNWVIGMIERNEHMMPENRNLLAGTLLWLACTSAEPVGSNALRRAKEGGATIAYEITRGGKGHGSNFRLILD
jgi:hypothetical protein